MTAPSSGSRPWCLVVESKTRDVSAVRSAQGDFIPLIREASVKLAGDQGGIDTRITERKRLSVFDNDQPLSRQQVMEDRLSVEMKPNAGRKGHASQIDGRAAGVKQFDKFKVFALVIPLGGLASGGRRRLVVDFREHESGGAGRLRASSINVLSCRMT